MQLSSLTAVRWLVVLLHARVQIDQVYSWIETKETKIGRLKVAAFRLFCLFLCTHLRGTAYMSGVQLSGHQFSPDVP